MRFRLKSIGLYSLFTSHISYCSFRIIRLFITKIITVKIILKCLARLHPCIGMPLKVLLNGNKQNAQKINFESSTFFFVSKAILPLLLYFHLLMGEQVVEEKLKQLLIPFQKYQSKKSFRSYNQICLMEYSLSKKIKERMQKDGKRFWAGDNIAEYVSEEDKKRLIRETTTAFEKVLDTLLIDRENDPNSKETAERLAKMYFNQIMVGRYEERPEATSFPNDSEDRYDGMLVVRSEIRSVCSHHHQPVSGVAYIGLIAAQKLIGLSKYTRIAQWCARRGTLQEELANDIVREIEKATGANNLGVYIQATHGCCENRGIMAHSSLTQTTVLKGSFKNDAGTKKEFFDNIKLQQDWASK